jgi:hypothetical protein
MESEEYVSSEISPTDTGMAGYTTAEVTDFGTNSAAAPRYSKLRRLRELRVSLSPRVA